LLMRRWEGKRRGRWLYLMIEEWLGLMKGEGRVTAGQE
jgi:hypothetical protein